LCPTKNNPIATIPIKFITFKGHLIINSKSYLVRLPGQIQNLKSISTKAIYPMRSSTNSVELVHQA